ncbi:MAG: PEP-utilizing enzyme, partial [Chitinivibrionales bacterium]|nr:PEP-utilizing enzyme [Chitinivibrionales bacterium]
SHAAIIARSLGVPAVTGLRDIMQHVRCGSTLLIDGDSGTVILEPTPAQIATFIPLEGAKSDTVVALRTPAGMEVCANASLVEDAHQAHLVNADGIGLFRTEITFLKAERLLTEDEQFEYYHEIVNIMAGKPVTFRLLDVGGDKPLPFMRIQKESNPYLGWRGARFLLGSPDILKPQIRALGRLSKIAPVNIMVPMIVDAVQQQQISSAIVEILQGVEHALENIKIGAMFEVPSACMQAREIFKIVDFGSIGSNDLIQYLFAVDRNNELVSRDYNPDHPILWETLRLLSAASSEAGKPLSICGEMAGRQSVPTRLVQTGITRLSVSPRLIPSVRSEMAGIAGA